LNAVNWKFADDHFRKLIEEKNGELSLEQFKKMIPCKNVRRLFLSYELADKEIFALFFFQFSHFLLKERLVFLTRTNPVKFLWWNITKHWISFAANL